MANNTQKPETTQKPADKTQRQHEVSPASKVRGLAKAVEVNKAVSRPAASTAVSKPAVNKAASMVVSRPEGNKTASMAVNRPAAAAAMTT